MMRYTDETPTRPGFYWLKNLTLNLEKVVQITLVEGRMKVLEPGNDVRFPLSFYDSQWSNFRWAGPIEGLEDEND